VTIDERLEVIENRLDALTLEVGKLCGANKSSTNLIKWVILPLILILGGLVGIKII